MEYLYLIVIAVIACGASVMTFISGFGLGTILLPVFMFVFPLPIAIAATAIVHFGNNIAKLFAVYRDIDIPILFRFGIPAIIAAAIGALFFEMAASMPILYTYTLNNIYELKILPVNLIVGSIIIIFTFLDDIKITQQKLSAYWLIIGGVLSGFFGGISGHQGALRSLVLSKTSLSKQQFVATGVVIACCVDIVRLFLYGSSISVKTYTVDSLLSIIVALCGAFLGIVIGKKQLQSMTHRQFHSIVKYGLLLFGILLIFGLLTR